MLTVTQQALCMTSKYTATLIKVEKHPPEKVKLKKKDLVVVSMSAATKLAGTKQKAAAVGMSTLREDFSGDRSSMDGFTFALCHGMGDKPPRREAFVISIWISGSRGSSRSWDG